MKGYASWAHALHKITKKHLQKGPHLMSDQNFVSQA